MSRVFTRTVLAGSSVLLGLIGGALMIAPVQFLEMSHIVLERDPSLMSELSAQGAVLLATSILMFVGAMRTDFARLALWVGALVYGSYGIGRVVSLALNGIPSSSQITAMVIELAVAALLIALCVTPTTHDAVLQDG